MSKKFTVSNRVKRLKKVTKKVFNSLTIAIIISLFSLTATLAYPGNHKHSVIDKAVINHNHDRSNTQKEAQYILKEKTDKNLIQINGESVDMGQGRLWSWVEIDNTGKLSAIGLSFTEPAMQVLPTEHTPGGIPHADGNDPSFEYQLLLPQLASLTPFKHIVVNWNPLGHHPGHFFGVPHFDFHFYTITPEERYQISTQNSAMFQYPDTKYIGTGYLAAVVPDEITLQNPQQTGSETDRMGLHWYDPKSSPYNGKVHNNMPFTRTFFYGSYDSKVIFWEPMVNIDYLKTNPNIINNIKLPSAYAESGYYPTEYSINYDAHKSIYSISLGGLVKREVTLSTSTFH